MTSHFEAISFLTNYGLAHDDYRHPNEVAVTMKKAEECPSPLLPESMDRLTRKKNPAMRARYSVWIWAKQLKHGGPMTPACTWCGTPTGYWCDHCDRIKVRPMRAICNKCEIEEKNCKPCMRGQDFKRLSIYKQLLDSIPWRPTWLRQPELRIVEPSYRCNSFT